MNEVGKIVKKKTSAKKPVEQRKVAPRIIVKSPARRESIDELCRDNPGKDFVYVPAGSPSGSLSMQGLVPVIGTNGKEMTVGSKLICESIDANRGKVVKDAHDEATKRVESIKDPALANSSDKTSNAKKPPS